MSEKVNFNSESDKQIHTNEEWNARHEVNKWELRGW